ncbi:MAG TPA: hypothetical protein VHB77_13205, partial [Planctomycetaceae bacterium]|nr:hypothetical protein [Planctomycetaceae bacterium]
MLWSMWPRVGLPIAVCMCGATIMPQYFLTGRNAQGKEIRQQVEAANPDEAVGRLQSQGFTEITLLTDDILSSKSYAPLREHMSPDQIIRYAQLTRWGRFWHILLRLYWQTGWMCALALGWLIVARAMNWRWRLTDVFAIGVLFLPMLIMGTNRLTRNGRRIYDKLVDAAGWYRWDEVAKLLPQLPEGIAPEERLFRGCQVVAGTGHLDDALERYRAGVKYLNRPEWFQYSRLSTLCLAGQDIDRHLEYSEKMAAAGPDQPLALIDAAASQAAFRRDTRRAREFLLAARSHAMVPIAKVHADLVEGIILVEEGKPQEAVAILEPVLKQLEFQAGQHIVVASSRDRAHAYLALACAGVG